MGTAKFYHEGQGIVICPDCNAQIFYAKDLRGVLVPVNYDPDYKNKNSSSHATLHVHIEKKVKTHDGSEQIEAFDLRQYTDKSKASI